MEGVARFSETLNERDAQLRQLLDQRQTSRRRCSPSAAARSSAWSRTPMHCWCAGKQSAALDQISGNISALSQQLEGFIDENRETLKPALDKLNGVLTIIDNRKERVQKGLKLLNSYAMSLGESVSSGPFFKNYIANLLPGQFVQPFIDAAFSDLGLDPNVLLPSERNDPQIGQPGTPALPLPYPRTGQGGEPHLTLPDAITGNPGDQGCGPPGLPLPGPTGCYPYREPLPAPPPGGPPPGPPAAAPPGVACTPLPTPAPVFLPAPGEVPHHAGRGGDSVNRISEQVWPSALVALLVAGVVVATADQRHRQPNQRRRPTSRTATASSSATTSASWASRSAGSPRSNRSPTRSRSRSGTTTSTRCPPTPRRRSCRRRWSPRAPSS